MNFIDAVAHTRRRWIFRRRWRELGEKSSLTACEGSLIATNCISQAYVPSCNDILADDWEVEDG